MFRIRTLLLETEAEFEFTVEEPEPIIAPKETFEDDEDAATA